MMNIMLWKYNAYNYIHCCIHLDSVWKKNRFDCLDLPSSVSSIIFCKSWKFGCWTFNFSENFCRNAQITAKFGSLKQEWVSLQSADAIFSIFFYMCRGFLWSRSENQEKMVYILRVSVVYDVLFYFFLQI